MVSYDEEYYLDWLGDNKEDLVKEFAEEEQDKFNEYCKNQFKLWCENQE